MAVKVRTRRPDVVLKAIVKILDKYAERHPKAEIETYRLNNVSVRIRVIDPDFKRLSLAEREKELWELFEELPDEVMAEVSLLILLTPGEAKKSFASMEFDDPLPTLP